MLFGIWIAVAIVGYFAPQPETAMLKIILKASCFFAAAITLVAADAGNALAPGQFWRDPVDISARDLFYGQGGREHQPRGTFRFVKEDREGSNPKFVIEDQDGVKWKVKLGPEARSETAASRLTWAVGYFTDDDYVLPDLRVGDMPARLHRGKDLVAPDGSMRNTRLERTLNDAEKTGSWRWRDYRSTGGREFNGLRVMMALLNNWDLKDVNNAIYEDKNSKTQFFAVSDLGGTFGAPSLGWPDTKSRDNLEAYRDSKFVARVTPEDVSFSAPGRPGFLRTVALPDFIARLGMRRIGRRIPLDDARWIGQLLGRLSTRQISDAFRAGGYSPQEVEGFTRVVRDRIAALNSL